MRIAFLTTTLDETNGWGRFAAGFLAEAKRRNGAANVIAPDPARLRSTEIRWKQPILAFLDALALRKELRDCDVIHAAIEPAAPLAFFLSLMLKKPYVVSVCGTFADLQSYSKPVRWLYRLAFRHAGRVAVLSRYTLKVFERGVHDAKTTIVYGGFVPPAHAPKKEHISAERRILAVGAIKPRKGFHTLLEALGALKKEGFSFRADCVGPKDEGGYVKKLEARLQELGLEDRVTFHGRVSEDALNRFYAEADLFVLPSEHSGTAFEGLGLVYLEAMAYGLPVIGCLESGAEDVIQDGVNGRLVPPGHVETLARTIKQMLGDEAEWKKMSEAAPGSIDRFHWENVGADMHAVYEAVVAARAKETPRGAKHAVERALVWSQKYTGTDMLYLAGGGFWLLLNALATSAISILLAVVFANFLPKETYGYYKYVLSIGGAFGFLTFTGMNAAVAQAVARGQDGAFPYSVRVQLRWNLLFSAALAAGAGYYLWQGNQTLGFSLLFLAVCTPITSAYTTYSAYFSGKKDFKTAAQYSTAAIALYALAMFGALLIRRDVLWLVAVYAISTALIALLFHHVTMARFRPQGLEEGERKKMLRLGTHLSFMNVLSSLAQYIDSIAVFKFVGAPELAIYTFANVMPDRLKALVKRGVGVVTPKLALKTPEEVLKSLWLRLAQGFAVGIPLSAGYILLAPIVFRYIFPQYEISTVYSQLIALNLLLAIPATYGVFTMQSQHLIKPLYFLTTVNNIIRILAVVAGGYFWGILGVILARLAASLMGVLCMMLVMHHDLRKKIADDAARVTAPAA